MLDKKGKGCSAKTDRKVHKCWTYWLPSNWIICLVFLNNKTVTSDKRKLKQSTNNFDDHNKRSTTFNMEVHINSTDYRTRWCGPRKLFAEVQFLVFVINFFLITLKTRFEITHQDGWVSISRLEAISGYSTGCRTHKSQSNNHMSPTLCT